MLDWIVMKLSEAGLTYKATVLLLAIVAVFVAFVVALRCGSI